MQKITWGLARNAEDKTSLTLPATDSLAMLVDQLDDAAPPTAVVRTVDLVDSVEVVASAAAPHELPALTRRELREREAKAAARTTFFSSANAARSRRRMSAAATPSVSTPSTPKQSVPKPSVSDRRHRTGIRRGAVAATTARRPISRPSVRPVASSARAPRVRHRILSNLLSASAMAGVGLILIATTVPANAFMAPVDADASSKTQEYVAPGTTQEMTVPSATTAAITRDGYTVVPLPKQVVAVDGTDFTFSNNPTGAVQWPFPSGSPISSGFGPRQVPGCGFCSTIHKGLDFTPGAVPIQAVADGVVTVAQDLPGGFGTHVYVDHVINGQQVRTLYAHMQYGSIQVAEGQQITAGQIIGVVGSSGASTGTHLHLEVQLNGTPVDPFAWLQANAG